MIAVEWEICAKLIGKPMGSTRHRGFGGPVIFVKRQPTIRGILHLGPQGRFKVFVPHDLLNAGQGRCFGQVMPWAFPNGQLGAGFPDKEDLSEGWIGTIREQKEGGLLLIDAG